MWMCWTPSRPAHAGTWTPSRPAHAGTWAPSRPAHAGTWAHQQHLMLDLPPHGPLPLSLSHPICTQFLMPEPVAAPEPVKGAKKGKDEPPPPPAEPPKRVRHGKGERLGTG